MRKETRMKKSIIIGMLCLSLLALAGCGATASQPSAPSKDTVAKATATPSDERKEDAQMITITNNSHKSTFALNDSAASKALLKQLPMTVEVKNFSDNEKLFYPKEKLPKDAPTALAKRGTLACFTPWGNLTIFYKDYGDGTDDDLIELGHITSGDEYIEGLEGQLTIEASAQ